MFGSSRHSNLNRALLGGASVLAITVMLGADTAHAAPATTEVATLDTITATNAAGLLESNATAAVALTINTAAGAITLGANNVDAISNTAGHEDSDITVTITSSGTANGVTFAGDITVTGNTGASVIINTTTDDITFQGNISSATGLAADINIGSGGADPTLTMTVDTANAENLSIEGAIDAVDAADTVTLAVANTETGARTVTFVSAIGGVPVRVEFWKSIDLPY